MKPGYIPIDIPTKKYIKAYVVAKLGPKPIMSLDNHVGNKLHGLLKGKGSNDEKDKFCSARYNDVMRVYVSRKTLYRKGCNLNETAIKIFNTYIEGLVKAEFYFMMDFFIDILPSFQGNLPEVRRKLGIDIEDWDDDSMRKDYYRYRLYTGKPLFYKKNAPTVPSARFTASAFF